jgi:acyl dehydratase
MSRPEHIYAEDLAVGVTIALGDWTPSRAEIIAFASQWDPQSFHLDEEAAARTPIGGLFASGMHSMAILQRLTVDGFYGRAAVIAGRRIRDVRFVRPVRPGMQLTGALQIEGVVARGDGRSVVTTRGTLRDGNGDVVLDLVAEGLFAPRPAT